MAVLQLLPGGGSGSCQVGPRPSARPVLRAVPPPGRVSGSTRVRRPAGVGSEAWSAPAGRTVGAGRGRAGTVPGGRGRPRPPLRLTRRGRWVVGAAVGVLFTVVVCAAVLLLVRPALAGTPALSGVPARPMAVHYHVVLPGETLLQIAARAVPGVDPRDTAVRIVELNALPSYGLAAGQRIALPAGG